MLHGNQQEKEQCVRKSQIQYDIQSDPHSSPPEYKIMTKEQ